MYKLVETFVAPQGEAAHLGKLSLFVRFFGCNYTCDFCDESLHSEPKNITEYSIEDLVKLYAESGVSHVVITGGEPTLQNLNSLIGALKGMWAYVQVETNGNKLYNVQAADWITVSPKFGDLIDNDRINEIKIPVDETTEEAYIGYYTARYDNVWLTPINNEKSLNLANTDVAIKLLNPAKLNIQAHKVWGVR